MGSCWIDWNARSAECVPASAGEQAKQPPPLVGGAEQEESSVARFQKIAELEALEAEVRRLRQALEAGAPPEEAAEEEAELRRAASVHTGLADMAGCVLRLPPSTDRSLETSQQQEEEEKECVPQEEERKAQEQQRQETLKFIPYPQLVHPLDPTKLASPEVSALAAILLAG